MKLTRPLATIDAETTGVEPVYDRIVTLYILKEHPDGREEDLDLKFNPGIHIPEETTEIHGMDDAMVADWPAFKTAAEQIHEFIKGCDLNGFNTGFDATILYEEFSRCGITWNTKGMHVIDVGGLFKIFEPRTLTAAVKFYCKREHEGAHGAKDDVLATRDVLNAQINRYADLMDLDVAGLKKASQHDPKVDLNGTIVLNDKGVPCYGTKKCRGVPVKDDPGYGWWMISKDFPTQTKEVLRSILETPDPDDIIP